MPTAILIKACQFRPKIVLPINPVAFIFFASAKDGLVNLEF